VQAWTNVRREIRAGADDQSVGRILRMIRVAALAPLHWVRFERELALRVSRRR
jgi:hypothetical protein